MEDVVCVSISKRHALSSGRPLMPMLCCRSISARTASFLCRSLAPFVWWCFVMFLHIHCAWVISRILVMNVFIHVSMCVLAPLCVRCSCCIVLILWDIFPSMKWRKPIASCALAAALIAPDIHGPLPVLSSCSNCLKPWRSIYLGIHLRSCPCVLFSSSQASRRSMPRRMMCLRVALVHRQRWSAVSLPGR